MEADVYTLYQSDFYQILDFKCRCKDCERSKPEYADSFSISFIRTGNFSFHVFRNSFDAHNDRFLLTKPGYEHSVTHHHYSKPDECTIIEFKNTFYNALKEEHGKNSFFNNNDLHSILLKSNVDLDFLHFSILQQVRLFAVPKLQIDSLVLDIVQHALDVLTIDPSPLNIPERLKKHHLITVEKAKDYITTHHIDDISLLEIADYCNVSVFHFSRVFKTFTNYSPYQYLSYVRLKKAEVLLRTTSLPITDICFSSGFNSIDHFSTAFKQRYNQAPSTFRLTLTPNSAQVR